MRRPVRRLVTGLVALVAMAGCSSSDGSPGVVPAESVGTTDPAAPSSEPAPPSGPRYVALGDSFTAAPGVGEASGPADCLRTDGNYPHLLAERLDLDLVDVSCVGATSADLRAVQGSPDRGLPPQLDAIDARTGLVTLSIGANDDGLFGSLVRSCAGFAGIATDQLCLAQGRFAEDRLVRGFDALAVQTERSVAAIRKRAPKAQVIVVGYPQLVPAAGTCDRLPMSRAEVVFVHDVNRRLADALRRGAVTAGVEYVDMWAASEGHDACAADPWVAGVQPEEPGAPLHPYAAHQVAVADALETLVG
ncbi:SGNH/GDSL hydrolase family protein [Nocardioides sp. Root190]|uniref:SGNH/GDSL hydrolase family protein n=1 Tax=Nocardioides sp. Root190 TaxID=1736488 RepID=UPI0009E74A41|nr:SGNH/GDSL hydrolase family protein [Nocardioides sp. Root190]